MTRKLNITAMIPAKLGSTRLPMKNLALLNGKPLIHYPIRAAKNSGAFNQIIINAEDAIFKKVADKYKVSFYKRPERLVKSTTKTDTVVYDFLKKNPCDIVAWVSPIAPFQTGEELKRIVEFFIKKKLDSLMTVKDEQVHCVYKNRSVNFNIDEIFAQTQDISPVGAFVYTTMMWRSRTFIKTFEKKGHALLSGKVGYFPVVKLSSVIVKKKEDLMLADSIMKSIGKDYKIKYDSLTNKIRRGNKR